jgi:RNA polymerase sigma-70 factor (ECF subfamily)
VVLVRQCQGGDSEAMSRLILRYQKRVYNTILKICGNVDDAAELTQETFVKAIENINKFQGKSSFYTWVFRIGVNLTLTHCKRSVKLGLRSLDAEQNDQPRQQLRDFLADKGSPDPAKVAENKELIELIKMAIMQLDDDQRAVIILRDIEQMSYAQIAKVLDIKLGTVRSRLSRARDNLRQIMEAVTK